MNNGLKVLIAFMFMTLLPAIVMAETAMDIMDTFYAGLAVILEDNMEDPRVCADKVDDYYMRNRRDVEKIRKMTKEGMKQAFSLMKDYGSMSAEELEALESAARPVSHMSRGMERYSDAMEKFAMKHPRYAAVISMKSMEFLPGAMTNQGERGYGRR